MKINFLILSFILIASCTSKTTTSPLSNEVKDDFYVGEKIDGPANIRDSINGNLLFELFDNVEIQSADFKNDWCEIGLFVKLNEKEYKNGKVEKGKDLINYDGQIIGKTLKEVTTWTDISNKDGYYGFIAGFTHKNNIKKESLIENILIDYLKTNSRNKNDFVSFIDKYEFEKREDILNYQCFYVYENWITDPSPGFRVCLLFQDNILQGIFHSRNIQIPNTTHYKLNNDFNVLFFDDYPKTKQVEFVNYMNEWLNSVD